MKSESGSGNGSTNSSLFHCRLHGDATGRASDKHFIDAKFDSRPGRCCIETLGRLLTPCVPRSTQPSTLLAMVK